MSVRSPHIRQPAVAGSFYPQSEEPLVAMLNQLMTESLPTDDLPVCPKVLITPHAGYIYSGSIAASAYKLLTPYSKRIRRVVLLGPSHRVPLQGIAIPEDSYFKTPLGTIAIDLHAIDQIRELPGVKISPHAHEYEHCLEVQLPFLQYLLEEFDIVPLVVGQVPPETISQVISRLWGGDETLFIVSTDLSHYQSYERAQSLDQQTTEAITSFSTNISGVQACGCNPLNGMLHAARQYYLKAAILDLRNSGDTAGSKDQVVGYGAYALY